MYVEKSLVFEHPSRGQGFTLIELMITIAIAAILLAIGIPSFRTMILQNRLSGNVNEFIAANMFARSEAIKLGQGVTLCPAVNAESGSNACVDPGDWSTGWLVTTTDPVTAIQTVLARQAALPSETSVTPAASAAITYTGMGQLKTTATSTLTFSNTSGCTRTVTVSPSGRSESAKPAGATC